MGDTYKGDFKKTYLIDAPQAGDPVSGNVFMALRLIVTGLSAGFSAEVCKRNASGLSRLLRPRNKQAVAARVLVMDPLRSNCVGDEGARIPCAKGRLDYE